MDGLDISSLEAGDSLPPGDIYGVSVHLPKWNDTVRWAERDPDFLLRLKTGYPRFFIPRVVLQLASCILKQAAPLLDSTKPDPVQSERRGSVGGHANIVPPHALLLSSLEAAQACRGYLAKANNQYEYLLQVTFPCTIRIVQGGDTTAPACLEPTCDIYAVPYSEGLVNEAKAFWQHTGSGVSSRCAVYWLQYAFQQTPELPCPKPPRQLTNKETKRTIQVLQERLAKCMTIPSRKVDAGGVILYPTGMSSISNVAIGISKLQRRQHHANRVAAFGFLYVDTLKVLSRINGFELKLYGHATTQDLDNLDADLDGGLRIDTLFTEFPGNPLLISPDLKRLHRLSLKHGFVLVVDDTVATSINVDALSYCDVVCTSLTKMFSGACNVMGGSATINPASRWHTDLQAVLRDQSNEPYFPLDVLAMEHNSRDFEVRVRQANKNALKVASRLRTHPAVEQVFYPFGSPSQHIYDDLRHSNGGYGFLISIRFVTDGAAIAFHDALDVAKGPSLGTNFTLACAYTLLAHYRELEWAAEFGVIEHLVRISVGIEDEAYLEGLVDRALEATGM